VPWHAGCGKQRLQGLVKKRDQLAKSNLGIDQEIARLLEEQPQTSWNMVRWAN
jgi:hypothetical protein